MPLFPSTEFVSGYCNRSNIEDIFGVDNVASYADKDRDKVTSKIESRINRAIVVGSATVDLMLRGGPYQIPLMFKIGYVDPKVIDWGAVFAGLWLYFSSGQVDNSGSPADSVGNQYKSLGKQAKTEILMVKGGIWRLDALKVVSNRPITTTPAVLTDTQVVACAVGGW